MVWVGTYGNGWMDGTVFLSSLSLSLHVFVYSRCIVLDGINGWIRKARTHKHTRESRYM